MPSPRSVRVSEEAEQEIQDILRYTFDHHGAEQTDRYSAGLLRALARLAEYPHIGRHRSDLAGQPYAWRFGEHLIFYRVTETEILIGRVLHNRQDPADLTKF